MAQVFPGTDLKAEPHRTSKFHVWKKNYGSLYTMLSRSGFGWNGASHILIVESNEIWDNYVKTDSNARTMRYKAWPFYKDWCEIFGKDRATDENAQGFADVVQYLLNKDRENISASAGGDYVLFTSFNKDVDAESMSICGDRSTTTMKTKSKGKKKKAY